MKLKVFFQKNQRIIYTLHHILLILESDKPNSERSDNSEEDEEDQFIFINETDEDFNRHHLVNIVVENEFFHQRYG